MRQRWVDFICWWKGHHYAVFHYFTGGTVDDITCCRCGRNVIWSDQIGWWVTR